MSSFTWGIQVAAYHSILGAMDQPQKGKYSVREQMREFSKMYKSFPCYLLKQADL